MATRMFPIFIAIITGSVVSSFIYPPKTEKPIIHQQENHAPEVKITSPQDNSSFGSNAQVIYTITVSDSEDGDSKYDEINPREVLLKVRYVKDETKLSTEINRKVRNEPAALESILTSNCFNCHKSVSKSIGPSFYAIRKKYAITNANIALLSKRIRYGSAGIWGKTSMPTHPELTKKETQNIVRWMLQNGANPDINYYTGLDGSFRINSHPASKRKGAYILTAIYIDHGIKDDPSKQRLKGQDVVVVHSR